MLLNTNLKGRVKNTRLPRTHALLPLFEAVINSIHAIEERGIPMREGLIEVQILRKNEKRLLEHETPESIHSFIITDNGIGFNEPNMQSFLTLDGDYKASKGARGVGRLLWLKAFSKVEVQSVYMDGSNKPRQREFVFTLEGIEEKTQRHEFAGGKAKIGSTVRLIGLKDTYSKAIPRDAFTIAQKLFEHCLWYFVRDEKAPKITIVDHDNRIDIDQFLNYLSPTIQRENVTIKGKPFEIIHTLISDDILNSHIMALCASSRLVKQVSLKGALPGLFGRLKKQDKGVYYSCYVTSPCLDEAVSSERIDFDMPEDIEGLLKDQVIARKDIKEAVLSRASLYLREYLKENIDKARNRIHEFATQKAPRYRPILKRIPEEKLVIDPEKPDKEIELFLHARLTELERELIEEGQGILRPARGEDLKDYSERVQEYLKKVSDVKKADLVNYVLKRRLVIDILVNALKEIEKGKYEQEEIIHNLIMPTKIESSDIGFDDCNLWLIDERLAFHDYMASDKSLSSIPITGSTDQKRPDLLSLHIFDNPILVSEKTDQPVGSIVIIELKRPMRDDANDDPIRQTLDYLKRVRAGKVKTARGRPIYNADEMPGFCYIICDITENIKNKAELYNLTRRYDYMGYFGYNSNFNAYIEVISFDLLIKNARERHRAFFDKLGIPVA